MKAPDYWNHAEGPDAEPFRRTLMGPLALAYRGGARLREITTLRHIPGVPVICVGNVTLGGTGKTPVTMALQKRLTALGRDVHVVSRGYGGRLRGPVRVDPAKHGYADVGDEALLLARHGPVWVAKNKVAGVKAAEKAGAECILLDDGLQNPSVVKTVSLCLVDAAYGFGNGRVFPAGPLRERPARALGRADAVVLVSSSGEDARPAGELLPRLDQDVPVLRAELMAVEAAPPSMVYAFAGIGRPQKFFNGLADAGVELAATASFPDHHEYSADELKELREAARRHNAVLMTTEKDHLRLPADLARMVKTWPVTAEFHDPAALDQLIEAAFAAFGSTQGKGRNGG